MTLSTKQARQFIDALAEAFGPSELERLVKYGFNERMSVISGAQTHRERIFHLVGWADADGLTEELLRVARRSNSRNVALRLLSEELKVLATTEELLAVMRPQNPHAWLVGLSEVENQVCRTQDGERSRTGFLVGADCVLTSLSPSEHPNADAQVSFQSSWVNYRVERRVRLGSSLELVFFDRQPAAS